MLDNFGLMEFLFLALLALLFFGPERLPQIGAKIGRWLRQLTQYSKAFMTQWSDEALVIQDAVAEVRGIRDEILAAQAEISGSLNTARTDITQSIDEARGTLRAAQPDPAAFLEGRPGPALAASTASAAAAHAAAKETSNEGSGDDVAISRTQQVVDDLLAKRATAPAVAEGGETEESVAESPAAEIVEPAPALPVEPTTVAQDKLDLAALEENKEKRQAESAFDRTQRVLDRLMGKEVAPVAEVEESASEPEITEAAPVQAASSPMIEAAAQSELAALANAEAAQPAPAPEVKETKESAFDRTQRVLDRLMGKETAPEEKVPVPEMAPALQAVQPDSQVAAAPAAAPSGTERIVPAIDLRRAASDTSGYSDYTKLSLEVSMLRNELRSLRQELQALQGAVKERPPAESRAETLGSVEEAA